MRASATAEETLLFRIRRETRDLHERLEKELNFPGRHPTRARYEEVLGRFYGFYVGWERNLEPWTRKLGARGIHLHAKTPDLITDLEFLSVDYARLPLCSVLPTCQTLPEAIGSLYVREGSALGGQIISRHLEAALALAGGAGYQFFSSAGRDVGREWRKFHQLLHDHSSPETDDSVIASARTAFDSIRAWLCNF